ncbi:MAG: hypothetical protein ABIV63_12165, partial [Caldimonas sp.]
TRAPLYSLVRHLLPDIQRMQTVDALCRLAVDEMKRLTGFGRIKHEALDRVLRRSRPGRIPIRM